MKKNTLFLRFSFVLYFMSVLNFVQAAAPLFAFSPLTDTKIQIPNNQTAIVQYNVINKSNKTHTLMMVPFNPIGSVTQITAAGNCASSFILGPQQSCTLTLQVNGSNIPFSIMGGPVVCQQGPDGKPSPFQCYRPSPANVLQISKVATTLYTGAQNGNVYYSIDDGFSWVKTNTPAGGSAINSVVATGARLYVGAANGNIYSSTNQGNTWSVLTTPAAGFAVNGLYASANKLYVASANGAVFICALNGAQCTPTSSPATDSAVNGVVASANTLYTASANGNVYYSNNNGSSWIAINGQPDGSAVKTIYLAANTLYVGTANEYVYTSSALTGGGSWSTYAQTVYSLFVKADASHIFAGTQSGYIFSLSLGMQLGFVASTLINSIFLY